MAPANGSACSFLGDGPVPDPSSGAPAARRPTREVAIGRLVIGGDHPIRVQSIADTFKGAEHVRLLYLAILWTLRVGIVIGILWFLLVLLRLARRLAQRSSGPRGEEVFRPGARA